MKPISLTAVLLGAMLAITASYAAQPPASAGTPAVPRLPSASTLPVAAHTNTNPVASVVVAQQQVQIELKKIGVSYAGAAINLHATLKSGGMPLANAKVLFFVEGLPNTSSGSSDAMGNVDVSVLPPEDKIGLHSVKAVYDGDASHKSAKAESTMDVWKTTVNIDNLSASLHHGVANGKLSEGWDLVVQGTLQRTTDKKPIASQPVQIRYAANGDNYFGTATTNGQGFFIFSKAIGLAPGEYVASVDYLQSAQNSEITKTTKFTVPNPNPVLGYFSQPTVTMPNGATVGQNAIINTRLTTAADGTGTPLSDLELMVCAMKTCVWPRSNAAGWLHATLPIKFGGSHPVTFTWRNLQISDGNSAKNIKFGTVITAPKPAVKVFATVPKGIIDGDHLKFTAQLLLAQNNAPADCYLLRIYIKKLDGTWEFQQNTGVCNSSVADPSIPMIKVDLHPNAFLNKPRPLQIRISYEDPNGFFLPAESAIFPVQVQPKDGGGPISADVTKTVK